MAADRARRFSDFLCGNDHNVQLARSLGTGYRDRFDIPGRARPGNKGHAVGYPLPFAVERIAEGGADRLLENSTNHRHQYFRFRGGELTYDDAGNLKKDHEGREFAYDFRNRLARVEMPDGQSIRMEYDALGRRVVKRVHLGSFEQTTRYVHDGRT